MRTLSNFNKLATFFDFSSRFFPQVINGSTSSKQQVFNSSLNCGVENDKSKNYTFKTEENEPDVAFSEKYTENVLLRDLMFLNLKRYRHQVFL